MLPKARILHHMTHRARIRVDSKKGDFDYFREVYEKLNSCETVQTLETNPVTGSILIRYTGDFNFIEDFAKNSGVFEIFENHLDKKWSDRFLEQVHALDRKIKRMSDDEFDLPSTLAFTFLGLSAVQFWNRQYFPAATSLLADALYLMVRTENSKESTPPPRD